MIYMGLESEKGKVREKGTGSSKYVQAGRAGGLDGASGYGSCRTDDKVRQGPRTCAPLPSQADQPPAHICTPEPEASVPRHLLRTQQLSGLRARLHPSGWIEQVLLRPQRWPPVIRWMKQSLRAHAI